MGEHGRTSLAAKPALGWFRIGERRRSADAEQPERRDGGAVGRLAQQSRRELLDTISGFLLDHDLAITPANLTAAFNAFSGASPSLMRRIVERTRQGTRVTQQWLDEVSQPGGPDVQDGRARKLLSELDAGIKQFARSTSAARSATGEYQSELGRHITELDVSGEGVEVASRLALLAREMAERMRQTEAELKSSEQEAKALRRRLDKARREAERDHLTGLPNRRAFEAELARQHAEAGETGEPLCVAFCDIDLFKRINDRHGHDAGDRVIKLVAQVLEDCSNDNCHVSRHGGEEFVLLFRGLTPAEAQARLDSARQGLAARSLFNRENDQPFGQITFSGGVADVFAHEDPREALKAADNALYRAKEGGRNCIVLA